jgi:acyl-CoA dehydrogenase
VAWDFETEPTFQRQLDWMDHFVRESVWPLEILAEELSRDEFSSELDRLRQIVKERGLWATHLPPEHGGHGFGQLKLALMHEIEGTSPWAPFVFGNQAPDSGNSEILALYATEQQKRRWLEPILSGAVYSAFSMTEPDNPGSDPVQMSTTAVRDGDGWVIDGHKWFTSNGLVADVLIVMAVTDPGAPAHQRASMFVVPASSPGVRPERNVPNLGGDEPFGFGHAEIRYEGVRVDDDQLLGGVGEGFAIAQARLGPGRIHHCMRWLGQCRRAFDMLCERAQSRVTRGQLLSAQQTVQNWIADSLAEIQAARMLTLQAAWTIDRFGVEAARRDISIIKYFGAQVLHNVIDRAIQINGALGYSEDLPLAGMYRRARAARIYDGPDEVHRMTVAKIALRDYVERPGEPPSDYVPARRVEALAEYQARAPRSVASFRFYSP